MHTIIAGRFDTQEQIVAAQQTLEQAGFDREAMAALYINPHGQHAIYPIGGDHGSSPGARHSGKGAAVGGGVGAALGAAAGLAAMPLVGPAGAAIGAGLGAYGGSLVGAVKNTDAESAVDEQPTKSQQQMTERASGILLAVRVDEHSRQAAIDRLLDHGGQDIEQAEGHLQDGHWHDFDPQKLPQRA